MNISIQATKDLEKEITVNRGKQLPVKPDTEIRAFDVVVVI